MVVYRDFQSSIENSVFAISVAIIPTAAVIPITAYAIPEAGVITISFVRNIGEVDVELINCASGEFVSDIVSSKDGGAIISFSGDIGHYRILFTTENGRDYIGEFDVE